MIEIKIPKEINEYEAKILFGFTWRQLLAATTGTITVLIVSNILKKVLPMEIVKYVPWFVGSPFVFFGFFKVNGLPLDKFLKVAFVDNYLSPKKRLYKIENYFDIKEPTIENEDNKKKKTKKAKYKKSKLSIK